MPIPKSYQRMAGEHPALINAYEQFGAACAAAGPLDAKTIALCKLALSIGANLEGAAHSHCRKALEAGCTPDELLHVATLAAPTIGFPSMMRGRNWVRDVVDDRTTP